MKVMMVLLLAQLLGTTTEDGAVGGRGDARRRRSGWREGAGQAVGGEDRDGEAGRGGRRSGGRRGRECSDQTSNGPISMLRCHPWISNADTTQYLKDL